LLAQTLRRCGGRLQHVDRSIFDPLATSEGNGHKKNALLVLCMILLNGLGCSLIIGTEGIILTNAHARIVGKERRLM